MIQGFGIVLACQLAGELLVTLGRLPVPAPICGMALLLTGLLLYGRVPESLAKVADGLTGNMSLLFVPAGVGAVTQGEVFQHHALVIALVLVAGSLLTFLVTAGVVEGLAACIALFRHGSEARDVRTRRAPHAANR